MKQSGSKTSFKNNIYKTTNSKKKQYGKLDNTRETML